MPERIPMKKWGKDHWSMLAYIETCCVDRGGIMEMSRIRMSRDYPTRIKNGEVQGHTDLDCAWDIVEEGLVEWGGTGINPLFVLTDRGWKVAGQLRKHIATAHPRQYASFKPEL